MRWYGAITLIGLKGDTVCKSHVLTYLELEIRGVGMGYKVWDLNE